MSIRHHGELMKIKMLIVIDCRCRLTGFCTIPITSGKKSEPVSFSIGFKSALW